MNCPKCNHDNHNIAKFCSLCGQKLSIEVENENYNKPIISISIFFFTLLAYICILHFTPFVRDYQSQLIADIIFAFIVLLFFFLNFKSTIKLFKLKRNATNFAWKTLIIVPFFALLVHFAATYLNQSVFDNSGEIYYNQFKGSPAPLLFSIISIGLFPAIFEEIAFRGVLFNQSLKIMGLKPTILITAILFTILHLSLISILWIFPIGLFFGYLRAKYKTMLYGIIFHFAYNTSIVIIQILLA